MIQTGRKPLPLMAYLAIMSISIIVNIPGLAITPMLGTLREVFPHTTQLEEQLLTVLPNLLIIPFVLLSGKLSLTRHKGAIIRGALILFTAAAVWYMLARTITELIVISCLIGIAAGLLIPFSTGLIADHFTGSYRTTQMGVQSGISNAVLVGATFVVGWLSQRGDWHLPFAVYLMSVIPLALCFRLPEEPPVASPPASRPSTLHSRPSTIDRRRIWGLIAVYFTVTFSTIMVSYYSPYLIERHHWSTELTGTVTALYFLFIFLPGFFLNSVLRCLRGLTFFWSGVMMAAGLGLFLFFPSPALMCVGASLAGLGYGIVQPLIYDKASLTASDPRKATLSIAFVLTANYLAIALAPVIIDGLCHLTGITARSSEGFTAGFILTAVMAITALVWRHGFVFSTRR